MASLNDLFEDFSRLREFTEPQVTELVASFRQINEILTEDLPSGLEGYAEFLKDKGLGGSGSKVEKLIKSSISSDCEQVIRSDAYKFLCAVVSSNYKSGPARKATINPESERDQFAETEIVELTSFKKDEQDSLSVLRVALSLGKHGTRAFRGIRNFRLPWLSSTSLKEIERENGTTGLPSFLFGRIKTLVRVTNDEIYETLFNTLKENIKGFRTSKTEPLLSFFEDDSKLRILEALVRNEFSKDTQSALSLWITHKLSELISQATNAPVTAIVKRVELEPYELTDDATTKLIKDNENYLLESLIPEASFMVQSFLPEHNFQAWQELDKVYIEFRDCLFQLSWTHRKTISSFLGEEDDLLYSEIYDFLSSNNLNTVAIPTIDELGKHKGGYSLVKKISQNNGLKAVRKKYTPWAMRKVAGDSGSQKDGKNSSSFEQNSIDNNTRELLDEISRLQQQLQSQQAQLGSLQKIHESRILASEEAARQRLEERQLLLKEHDLLKTRVQEGEAIHQKEIQLMQEKIQQLKKENRRLN